MATPSVPTKNTGGHVFALTGVGPDVFYSLSLKQEGGTQLVVSTFRV